MAVNKSRGEWKIHGGVFDQWTLRVLEKLRGQGHFEDLDSPIAMGKEANVFKAIADEPIVVKIYRLENREFKKMLEYLVADPRYMHVKRRKREIVFAWTQREYRNLLLAREHIPVPKPIAFHKNVFIMEMIGSPAQQLKDQPPKDPQAFFATIIEFMWKLRNGGMVHGDLSEFNILNFDETPIFIDFSQSGPVESPNAQELWDRDVQNIIRAAKKFDVELTEEDFVSQ